MDLSPVARVANLSKNDFHSRFRQERKPVVMKKLTENWPAREKWTLGYLKQVAGAAEVPLYENQPFPGRKYQYAPATRMTLADFIERIEAGENDLRIFSLNILSALPQLASDFCWPDRGLPLFRKTAFLFAGGAGAKVPMHFDIDLPDLLLCHFGGRKRVMLFPPEQSRHLYRVPFSFSSLRAIDFDNPDYARFPALARLKGEVAELGHGDVLYIPPGYWHYIVYEGTGFSMSLRALPREPVNILRMAHNLVVIRSIERLMRKLLGKGWHARNERVAMANAPDRTIRPHALAANHLHRTES
jgi:hypothetical protein